MDSNGNGNETLSQKFRRAVEQFHSLSNGSLDRASLESNPVECNTLFGTIQNAIDSLGVFSPNEFIEEIATVDLKYLVIPYYQGMLFLMNNDMNTRLESIESAKTQFLNFLYTLHTLEFLDEKYLPFIENPENFTVPPTREERIARFKELKAIENELKVMEKQLDEFFRANGEVTDIPSDIEDLLREKLLSQLRMCTYKSLDEMSTVCREIEMLQQVAQMKTEGRDLQKEMEESRARAFPKQKELKPLDIYNIDRRGVVRKGVFQNPNPPTMTLDEYFEHAIAVGEIPDPEEVEKQRRESQKQLRQRKYESFGDEEAAKDEIGEEEENENNPAKQLKARAWADWCDENPKGAGNTLGNIG
eukprot:GCRY01002564.1.p1 GENE.GCRY01002564.1~~GCRY01002564.1.p1  ORF type:complete len:360 (+),score=50.74 GCRY01002564.1:97-1176(+)